MIDSGPQTESPVFRLGFRFLQAVELSGRLVGDGWVGLRLRTASSLPSDAAPASVVAPRSGVLASGSAISLNVRFAGECWDDGDSRGQGSALLIELRSLVGLFGAAIRA